MATSFVTNAGALATRKRLFAGQMSEQFGHAATAHAKAMKEEAEKLSRGTLTPIALRRLGHPYSRRFPAGSAPVPDFVVNKRSGDFLRSWKFRVQKNANDWTISVWNVSAHARWMMGTPLMRERPILTEVRRRVRGQFGKKVKGVISETMRNVGQGAPVPSGGSAAGGVLYALSAGLGEVTRIAAESAAGGN